MTNSHPIDRAALVASTPVKQMAVIVARGAFAMALPLFLFAVLGGAAAAVAVASYQFTIHLFGL